MQFYSGPLMHLLSGLDTRVVDSFQPKVGLLVCRTAGERDAGRESVDAPDPRSFATAVCQRAAAACDCQELGAEPGSGQRLSEPGPRRRRELALGRRSRLRA